MGSVLLLAVALLHCSGGHSGHISLEEGLRTVVKHQKVIIAKETVPSTLAPPNLPLAL